MNSTIDRYFTARDRAKVEPSYSVPPQLLRDYLDLMAIGKRNAPGLHNITITVRRVPATGLLNWDLMLEEGVEIRVEGQKWSR